MYVNTQHVGERKWREQLKTSLAYVSGTKRDGSTNILLERHISNYRQAYINLYGAAEHIDYQLPNERKRRRRQKMIMGLLLKYVKL